MTTPDRRPVVTLVVAVLAACVAFQLNASMLSPALVTMARELGTDDATVGLSQTMFFTLAAMFSLFLPRLSDIAGRRRVLLVMLAVMLVGSVVAALAVSVPMLFAGRALQGITGPVVPICLLMTTNRLASPSGPAGTVPRSYTATTHGWSIRAASRASRSNRVRKAWSPAIRGSITLIATARSRRVSVPWCTVDMPPRASTGPTR